MGPAALALIASLAAAAADPATLSVTTASRAIAPGEIVVLTIAAPAAADAVTVRAFDRLVRVGPLPAAAPPTVDNVRRWRAVLGIDLDVAPGTYTVTVDAGNAHSTLDLEVVTKTFRTRRLTVDPNFVTPPPSAAARIAAESKLLAKTWQAALADPQWTMPFHSPVPHPANSAFGTRSVFNGQPRNAHGGADFLSPAGTPVHAPNAGRVVIARNLYFSGNTVVIDHGAGVFSMLAHLSAFDVREGDVVVPQQIVGRVGATGRVTGAHLHWAVRAADARVDPMSLLAILGKP